MISYADLMLRTVVIFDYDGNFRELPYEVPYINENGEQLDEVRAEFDLSSDNPNQIIIKFQNCENFEKTTMTFDLTGVPVCEWEYNVAYDYEEH